MHHLCGIWVPLITPFTADRQVDYVALRSLIIELREAGVAGLVVFGTTGEPATLSEDEKRRVIACVLAEGGPLPIILGVSAITADEVCEKLVAWDSLPLAGVLVTPPYYVRPSQEAIVQFFGAITTRTARPLIVYDVPYRTGVQMELETLRAIARFPSVIGVKDCGGDARKTQALIADRQLAVLGGDDHLIFTTIAQGGAGAIAASAHLHPRLFVEMHRALLDNRLETACTIHHALAPMVDALFCEPSPAPLKAVLSKLGRGHLAVRRPLMTASDAAVARAYGAYCRAAELAGFAT